MWQSGWLWFKSLRGPRATVRPDRCDMGIEIGLDESLESRLPPLLEVAASRPHDLSRGVSPLGTDHRSRFA